MSKDKKSTINVQGTSIAILSQREEDFNLLEFDGLAIKSVASYAMNARAIGCYDQ